MRQHGNTARAVYLLDDDTRFFQWRQACIVVQRHRQRRSLETIQPENMENALQAVPAADIEFTAGQDPHGLRRAVGQASGECARSVTASISYPARA